MKGKWFFVVGAVAVASCGGGGGGSSSTPEGEGAEFAFGSLVGRAASTNPPLTTNSSFITATGFTGLITALRLKDQEVNTNELRVLFTSSMQQIGNSNPDIYACNIDGTDLARITSTPSQNEFEPSPSPDGKRIAFSAPGPGGDHDIFVMNMDGTNRVQMTDNGISDLYPRWAPTGNNLAYSNANGELSVLNVTTKVVTPVLADVWNNGRPDWSVDGSLLYFESNRGGDGFYRLYSTPSSGGGPVSDLFSAAGTGSILVRAAPNGLLFSYVDTTTSHALVRPFNGLSITGPAVSTAASWSPDSSKIIYTRMSNGFASVFMANPDGSGEQEILGNVAASKGSPSFIPAPKEVVFVGPGSLFGSRLAGVIFAQRGNSVKGLLGFDVDTPSTAVLTKQTGENNTGPNLVYSIDADSVREVSYAHAPYWKPIKVVGAGTSVPSAAGALVSIDSISGRVVAVLPFSGSRGEKTTFHDDGNTRVFTGNFLGAFDKNGKNVAGGSSSEARLNLNTGELTAS